jgi:hypothetical protein
MSIRFALTAAQVDAVIAAAHYTADSVGSDYGDTWTEQRVDELLAAKDVLTEARQTGHAGRTRRDAR